jgi:hypothetical protein
LLIEIQILDKTNSALTFVSSLSGEAIAALHSLSILYLMFKPFATFAMFILLATSGNSQTVATKDQAGNYTQVVVAATVESLTKDATKQPGTFTAKDGQTFPVYLSKSGKLFVVRTSKKTGNPYRSYFATTEQGQ